MKPAHLLPPPKATILVIDDEPDLLTLFDERLSSCGFRVLTAASAMAGLNQARLHLPDLILLDIMLGDMDGFSACEILRSQPSTAGTPVIIMTAMPGEITRLNSFASGAMDFVEKPLRFRELLARIESMLARRDTLRPGSGQAERSPEANFGIGAMGREPAG